jgi:hypothetical protein
MTGEAPVVAIVRGDELIRFDDPEARVVRTGDRLVCLCSNESEKAPAA